MVARETGGVHVSQSCSPRPWPPPRRSRRRYAIPRRGDLAERRPGRRGRERRPLRVRGRAASASWWSAAARTARSSRPIDPCPTCFYAGLGLVAGRPGAGLRRLQPQGPDRHPGGGPRRQGRARSLGLRGPARRRRAGRRTARRWRCWPPTGRASRPAPPRPARPWSARSAARPTSSASPSCPRSAGGRAEVPSRPPTPSSTSTTGPPTARASWPPRPRATATTTGGSPSWRRSASTARSARSPRRGVQMKFPRVSPDGRTVAFIGGLHARLRPDRRRPLDRALRAAATAVDRTPGFKGSFTSLIWRGKALFATAIVGDHNARPDRRSGHRRDQDPALRPGRPSRPATARSRSARDGKLDGRRRPRTSPPRRTSARARSAAPRQITHDNDALAPQVTARSVTWKNEGFDVQGWLTGPRDRRARQDLSDDRRWCTAARARRSQPTYMWKGTTNDLVAARLLRLPAQPARLLRPGRGLHQGQRQGLRRRRPARHPGRRRRGGEGRPRRRQAPGRLRPLLRRLHDHVDGHPLQPLQGRAWPAPASPTGSATTARTASTSGWSRSSATTAYNDPAAYDRFSPIRYIKAAKTPTFIYVGERDVECPPAQSLEFHAWPATPWACPTAW